jgi:CheY-like chemotaxis protein/nitrogen-specific signal transduction histidine kinase
MAIRNLIRTLLRRQVQLTLFSGLAGVCLMAAVYMTAQVFLKLDDFGSAASDNIQWTVTQLEVEQVKAINAFERLDAADPETIREAIRRFNALYSRTLTLENSRSYAAAMANTEAEAQLGEIHSTLNTILPVIDGPTADLMAARPDLIATLEGLTAQIRRLSSASLAIDARQSERERDELHSQLMRLTALVLLMVVGMLSLLILLWRLFRLYRRRALENRATLNRLSTILDTSQDAVLVVRPDGAIMDKNTAADRMFGLDETGGSRSVTIENILLRRNEETGDLTPLPGSRLVESCAEGPNRCANLTARGPEGQLFPVELSADMTNQTGDEVCVCFIRDISRRVAAEAEMRVARDNALAGERAKARFLAMISHEMRTPLHGILGTLDLLEETRLTGEQTRYAQILHDSGQQLLSQINDALDVTQANGNGLRLRDSVFDLDRMLKDLVTAQRRDAEARNTTLEILPSTRPLGHVLGDKGRVQQVLVNLVVNAIKFTENGAITIEAIRHEDTGSHPSIVEFQISDTGMGIAEEDLPRIFDDYVRLGGAASAQIEGTGLGLGIARQLVTLMGGQIGVESEAGDGSLFWVRLPLPSSDRVMSSATSEGLLPDGSSRRVLIAEDNESNRFVLTRMLEKDGHSVRAAADGAEAVAAAEEEQFDMILMDISMPGIGGLEAAHRIKHGDGPCQDTRLIFLTAHLNLEPDAELRGSGAEGILTKPLPRDDLRAILAGKRPPTDLSQSPPANGAPILDRHILDQLSEMISPSHLSATLREFNADTADLLKNAPKMLAEPAPDALAEKLHKLAGSAAILGASAMQATLSRAEDACLAGRFDDVERGLSTLHETWMATRASLASYDTAA